MKINNEVFEDGMVHVLSIPETDQPKARIVVVEQGYKNTPGKTTCGKNMFVLVHGKVTINGATLSKFGECITLQKDDAVSIEAHLPSCYKILME